MHACHERDLRSNPLFEEKTTTTSANTGEMHMNIRRFLPVLLLLFAIPCVGQTYYGGLRGTLTDPTGLAITNATVKLINEATNVERAVITNTSGEYVFNSLDPATYSLKVQATGFKVLAKNGVVVSTQEFVTMDVKLEMGQANETVSVSAEAPVLENSNASNGQVINVQKLQDLPNLGRNPFLFSKLNNNVSAVGDPRFNRFQDQSGSSQISIAGGPIRGNNYRIDGVAITDSQNRAVIIPSIEATQEVKVQANTYDAEMGRTGGGVFNTSLRSGTNSFHGSLLGYTRQTEWLANNYFLNRAGTPRPDTPFYNYAGSFGGPVWIPRLYNGHDKTFFWVAEEGYTL